MESANRKCGSFGSLAIILSGILHFVCTFTKKFNTFNQTIWTVLLAFLFNLFWCSPSKLLCCCLSVSQLVDTTTTSVHFNRRGCLNWNEICYTGYQYNIYVKLNFEKFQPNKCVFCNEPHTSILTVYTRFLLIFWNWT